MYLSNASNGMTQEANMGVQARPRNNGQRVSGVWKTDYDLGFDDAMVERFSEYDTRPLCRGSRSRDYWLGYKAGYQKRHGIDSGTADDTRVLANEQKRVIVDALLAQGVSEFSLSQYMRKGGDLGSLVKLLGG